MKARGRIRTDAEGRYWFRSIRPTFYPVPTDGPVGRMLRKMGRHPYRPGHIHMIVSAPGHLPVTTHLFVAGQRIPGFRCGVRHEGVARRAVRPASAGRRPRWRAHGDAVLHGQLRLPVEASERADAAVKNRGRRVTLPLSAWGIISKRSVITVTNSPLMSWSALMKLSSVIIVVDARRIARGQIVTRVVKELVPPERGDLRHTDSPASRRGDLQWAQAPTSASFLRAFFQPREIRPGAFPPNSIRCRMPRTGWSPALSARTRPGRHFRVDRACHNPSCSIWRKIKVGQHSLTDPANQLRNTGKTQFAALLEHFQHAQGPFVGHPCDDAQYDSVDLAGWLSSGCPRGSQR